MGGDKEETTPMQYAYCSSIVNRCEEDASTSVERTLLTVRILGLSRDHDCREIQHIHQVQQGYTPNDQPGASYLVTAAAGSAGLAAKGKRASSSPILSSRSIAVTRIWADSGASVESFALDLCATGP
jgi:hypothetical protein